MVAKKTDKQETFDYINKIRKQKVAEKKSLIKKTKRKDDSLAKPKSSAKNQGIDTRV